MKPSDFLFSTTIRSEFYFANFVNLMTLLTTECYHANNVKFENVCFHVVEFIDFWPMKRKTLKQAERL